MGDKMRSTMLKAKRLPKLAERGMQPYLPLLKGGCNRCKCSSLRSDLEETKSTRTRERDICILFEFAIEI